MVDVAHDRNHRGARLEVLRLVIHVQLKLFDRGVNDPLTFNALFNFETKAVFGAKLGGNFFIHRL